MPAYESITSSQNFAYQFDTSLSGDFRNVVENLRSKPSFNRTTTIKDIAGVKGLTIQSTGSLGNSFSFTNTTKVQYEKGVGNGVKFKTGARLSGDKITVDVMLESSDGFSCGIEANGTLRLSELRANGFYIVAGVPLFGMQMVLKYNPITEDVVVILRKPLPDGNDEDKKGAAACSCAVNYVTVDVMTQVVKYNVVEVENTSNYNYNYNNYNYNRNDTNTNEPGVLENLGKGVVAVGEGIGRGVETVADGVADAIVGFIGFFKPKARREQYAYN